MGLYEKVKELSRYGEVVSGDRKEKYLVKQIKAQFEPHFDEIKIYPTEVLSWSNKELEIECEGGKVPKSDIVTLPYSPSADLEYRFVKIVNEGVIYKAFSRSDSLFIDLLVHVTRLDIYSKEELETYSTVIQYEVKTIARLSPNLLKILRDLVALINAKGLKISL